MSDTYKGVLINRYPPLRCDSCNSIRVFMDRHKNKKSCEDCNSTSTSEVAKSPTGSIEDSGHFKNLKSIFNI